MKRAALAMAPALALTSGACGTQEWGFYDPAAARADDAGFDACENDAPSGDDATRCPASCAGGAPCPATAPVCTQPHAICQGCRSNEDCSNVRVGPICTSSGTCAPECSSDRSCSGSRPRCARPIGRCVRCLDDGDCPPGDVCIAPSLSCAPPHGP